MIGLRRDEYRTRALQLLTLLLILSFAAIPVRCDASTGPHSIFVDPMDMRATADRQAEAAPVASHQHQHHAGMQKMADMTSDAAGAEGAATTDLHSQQPVGAAFDLPTTPVPPVSTALLPLEGELVIIVSASPVALTGIAAPPEAPPPKSA